MKYFVQIRSKGSIGRKNTLKLLYNENNIGNISSILQTEPVKRLPVKSITDDIILIQSTEGDLCHTEKISVDSILWQDGRQVDVSNITLHFELIATIKSSSKEQVSAADVARNNLVAANLASLEPVYCPIG